MDGIELCVKMPGFPNRAYFGGGPQLPQLLIDSGWSQADSINDLTFYEVMKAVDFISSFLEKEGFRVGTKCTSYGLDLIITWEKN